MIDYRKIAEDALKKANESNGVLPSASLTRLDENLVYPDGLKERMDPQLERDLKRQETSLGKHPIFPEGDEYSFEQKIMGERFAEVANRYKSSHGVDKIDTMKAKMELMPMVKKAMSLEVKHKKELEELAIKMIREEFDMDEDVVEIRAELKEHIDIEGTRLNPSPIKNDMTFKDHDEMIQAKDEVYKRRFVNAIIQGAAKKCNHMFHLVNEELSEIDPKLSNLYSKMMSTADYMYYIVPNIEKGVNGGVVRVEFPSGENSKPIIHAQAMVFPVLIHELIKGVMEILSARGLPKKKMGKFVLDKADYLSAEPWDMRIGPALWTKFTDCFDVEDFKLKHHVWNELVGLPVKEFNIKLKEIMAGTKTGKKIIKDLVNDVRNDLKNDELDETMKTIDAEENENIESYDWTELMGDDDDDSEEGYDDIDKIFK